MSVCRPAGCLIRASETSIPRLRPSLKAHPIRRPFHSTSVRPRRRYRPHYQSIKASELQKLERDAAKAFPPFTEQQWEAMKAHYTPEQIEVLKLAEEAIDPKDLHTQKSLRDDAWHVEYSEDFSRIDPLLDKQPKAEVTGEQPRFEIIDEENEWEREYARRVKDVVTGKADPRTTEKIIQSVLDAPEADNRSKLLATRIRQFIGTDKEQVGRDILKQLCAKLGLEAPVPEYAGDYGGNVMDSEDWLQGIGLDPLKDEFDLLKSGDKELLKRTLHDPAYSVLNPPIPKFDDPRVRYPSAEESDPMASSLRRLSLMTGRSVQELKRFRTKNLVINRVVNQTRMGKIPSFYSLSIAGDGNGLLGIGEGKSAEMADSIRQSHIKSIRNMKPVLRYEARTIYGEVWGKVGATEVELSARPPGFGARCQHLIFEMCRLAGIRDLAARVTRARNPMNTVKAAFQALTKQRLPEDIARARGRKLVDVRKVYYAGNVL